MDDTLSLSIVIPVLNEELNIPVLLSQLSAQTDIDLQIIVSDGGSTDQTQNIVNNSPALLVSSAKNRAAQMNTGAKAANNEFLLFLHADTTMPDTQLLAKALQFFVSHKSTKELAGHFPLCFVNCQESKKSKYTYYERKTELSRPGTINGDQGMLMRKSFFDSLGGFDETMPFLEDQRLAEKIQKHGEWILLPGVLETSARRFEVEGLARRMILSMIIMGLHNTGFKEFFERAPELYREQSETSQLELVPFFRLISRLNRKAGLRKSFKRWFLVGRFSRINFWQVFFFLDVTIARYTQTETRHFLRFHDQIIFPALHNRFGDLLSTFVMFSALSLIRLYFEIEYAIKNKPS